MFDHSKLDFEVEKFPLFHSWNIDYCYRRSGEVPSNIGVGIRRKDTKQPLGIVSENYEIVQYMDIVDGVEKAINKSGLDLTDAMFKTDVHDGGSKIALTAKFPAHEQSIGKLTDTVIPELKFRTSQNRTWANNMMVGLWRSMCYNTLVNGDKLAYIYGRHTKNFNVDGFATKIQKAGEFIAGDGMNEMRTWYDTKVTRDQAIDLFSTTLARRTDNVTRKKVANKVMLSNLMKTFDEENRHLHGRGTYDKYGTSDSGSLWSAYNAATWWSTHGQTRQGSSLHNAKPIREEKVRKMIKSKAWKELLVA